MTIEHTTVRDLSIHRIREGYETGEFTPEEIAAAHLDQIGSGDPCNAFCLVDPDETMRMAAESTARWRAGKPLGNLDGVPVTLKDALLTKGWPMLKASWLNDADGPWTEDAPSVARLREAGAVFLGKTTTPEFAWKGVTDSDRTGITRNPWNLERTSGGSSGGAAAAAAQGIGAVAIGSDGGGSIRIPASFCGVVGLKATFARVPAYPASPFGQLSHVGPLARRAADIAEVMDVITGYDPRDPDAAWDARSDFRAGLEHILPGLRIGYSADLGFADVQDEVSAATKEAVLVLGEVLGASVSWVEPLFDDPIDAFHILWFSGCAKVLAGYGDRVGRETIDPGLLEVSDQGAELSASDYLDALAVRGDLRRRMAEYFLGHDLLVTPTMPRTAFEAGREVPDGSGLKRWTQWTPFTYPFNMTGNPAITVPCGTDSAGLPIGLQIIGRHGADELLVAVAAQFQKAVGLPGPATPAPSAAAA